MDVFDHVFPDGIQHSISLRNILQYLIVGIPAGLIAWSGMEDKYQKALREARVPASPGGELPPHITHYKLGLIQNQNDVVRKLLNITPEFLALQCGLAVPVNVPSVSNANDGYNQSVILDLVDNPKVAFANSI